MKKYALLTTTFVVLGIASYAQSQNASSSQTIQLELTDAIEVRFDETGTNIGSVVKFQFGNPGQYKSGLESAEYKLTIRSNKKFNVLLNTTGPNFTYSGTTIPAPVMPVYGVLHIMMTQNSTGGASTSLFPLNQYGAVTELPQTMLTTCQNGGNQQMVIKYKAEPGFSYPSGVYTVDAVYTASQM